MLKYMLLNLMAILFINNRTWANKQKCDREISEESEIQQSEAILQSICRIRFCISRLDVQSIMTLKFAHGGWNVTSPPSNSQNTSSVSTNSTRFPHYLLEDGIRHSRLTAQS